MGKLVVPSFLRLATDSDAEQILEIYGPFCTKTPVSFEVEPPSADVIQARITQTVPHLPWLVCEKDDLIRGYVYASPHRARAAYQWSVDVTVYVGEGQRRRGV